MDTKKTHIHRGEILDAVARRSEFPITQVAKKARFSRGSYYNHIRDPDLPFEILERYGAVLKHDFTADIPKMPKYDLENTTATRTTPTNLEEALLDRDYWRDKYVTLLEQNRTLMERYHKLLEAKLPNEA